MERSHCRAPCAGRRHRSPDATSVFPVRLRDAWPAELDLMARPAGLELKHRNGGWACEAFTGASTAHVSTYGR